jgi:DNA-binding NarL/FixJ family response regulator
LQPSPVRILMVDDFEPWRRFAYSLLRKKPELQIVGEACDGQEAVQKALQLKPDLILMDMHLPRLNGLVAARQIRKLVPESKVISLTQESSAEVARVARMYARGYVVKANAATELLAAVEAVLSGESFISGT